MPTTVFVKDYPYRQVTGLEREAQDELRRNFDALLEQLVPIGTVLDWAGQSTVVVPRGWLLCDGSAVNRQQYQPLFAVIGTTYGVGDGLTTFNLPNDKGRVTVGQDAGQAEFAVLGQTGGSKAIAAADMPSHTHVQNAHGHGVTDPTHAHACGGDAGFVVGRSYTTGNGYSSTTVTQSMTLSSIDANATGVTVINATATNQNTGGGGVAGKLPPYMVLRKIIKT